MSLEHKKGSNQLDHEEEEEKKRNEKFMGQT